MLKYLKSVRWVKRSLLSLEMDVNLQGKSYNDLSFDSTWDGSSPPLLCQMPKGNDLVGKA